MDQGGGGGASLVNPVNVWERPPGVSDVQKRCQPHSTQGPVMGGGGAVRADLDPVPGHKQEPDIAASGFKSMILQRGSLGTGLDNFKTY